MFGHFQEIKDLTQSLEELYQQQQLVDVSRVAAPITLPSPNVTPDKHHVGVELAECKAKMRKLRQELYVPVRRGDDLSSRCRNCQWSLG